jgi:hypothetical protein
MFLGMLYAGTRLLAAALAWLAAHSERWADLGAMLLSSDSRVTGEAIAVGVIIALAWVVPAGLPGLRMPRWASWERSFSRLAARRFQAVLLAGILPAITRLALLPVLPPPVPLMPDEFSHLLLAGTFASGRITNPPHPMWPYFETLYVLQQPTYTSLYPVAQGFSMAVPLALGAHPWFGVWATMALMCAALAWMLQGWLPPRWALLGALLGGFRLSISTYWMNSYWGGAVSALGGALVLGALPRLARRPRVRDALLFGLGVAVLSQSRPFEGALLSLPAGAWLLYRLARQFFRNIRVLTALASCGAAIIAGTLYYNRRVTGDAWLWPYQWHQKVYGTPQNLRGSAPVLAASRAAAQPDIWDNYEWQLGLFQSQATWNGLAASLPEKADVFWDFYFEPICSLPLLFLPLARPRVRWALFGGLSVLAAVLILYPFFFPHYAAPVYGLLLVWLLQGARRMRAARWRNRRVGLPLFRWWLLAAAAACLSLIAGSALAPDLVVQSSTPRSQIEKDLKHRGGKHLVLVRYTEAHNFHHPWIYNGANIDRSPVVWARAMDAPHMTSLLEYFKDRQVWLVRVGGDDEIPKLEAYRSAVSDASHPPR